MAPTAETKPGQSAPGSTETPMSRDDVVKADAVTTAETALPPLSSAEFKEYNHLAEQMDYFHNHFRQSWMVLHNAATSRRRPGNMTLKQFLDLGLGFVRQLTMHHDIEETYLYPLLAVKMPEFRHHHDNEPRGKNGSGHNTKTKLTPEASELIRQHQEIHDGMDKFEGYLLQCRNREVDLEMTLLKEKMDSWGGVLWTHMDQEVETLGAENMRKYWTLQEIRELRHSM